ncbi:HTH-type transcriptional regulator YesS [Paenibacillus konkukensis]|uniref:HTH-type transcriptional regulator YesS n=1 Tax=Paenibacillus konkukensis TaxID=2020716 RepID=A0ABY4RKZ7_9BACL|nr:helix-turn-helix domain-containing protein [Paenibacillus konkukensis]UQZ82324.1 HTH-type transcriptional regulator YesS [Paenibacillus konkukensis]
MRRKKFYYRLFVAYVLIVLVYTILVSSMFFYKNNEIVQLELKYRQDAFLREVRDKIDTQLNIASNVINQLKINPNVLDFAQQNDRDYYVITKIYNDLSKNLDAFANFGFTIGLGKRDDDLIITPHQTSTKERFYAEIGLEPIHQKEIETKIWEGSFSKSIFLQTFGGAGDRRITLVKREPNLDLLFFISFYESYLLPPMSGGSEAFALVKGDRMIAWNGSVDEDMMLRLMTGEPAKNSGATVRFLDSKVYSDLKYGYAESKTWISPEMKALAKDSLAVYVVLAALGLLLAVLAANRTYRPIQKAVNQFKHYGQPEGKDELAFMQSAADGIHQLNEKLKQTIRSYQLPLRKKMIRDLLFGLVPGKKAAAELGRHDMSQWTGPVTVAIVEVAEEGELGEAYAKHHLCEITNQVSELIESYISREQACETLGLDYKRFAVLLSAEEETSMLRRRMTAILRDISQSLSIPLVAAMGERVAHIGEAEHSFREASTMMEYRFVMDRNILITVDELKQLRNTGYYYPLELERDLIAGVVSGNESKAIGVLNRLLEENLDIRSLSIEKRSQFIMAIVSTLNRINQQLAGKDPNASSAEEKWYPKLMLCSDLEKLKEAIHRLFGGVIERIQTQQTGEIEQSMAYQAVEYIHQRYDQDISLNDIAERFQYSPSYISTLFKEHTGDNFRDYLNHYRVRKAKEIMNEERGIKIQDLALRVGCNNVNTFIRMFKRYEGVSPGQYAQQLE